MSFRKDNHIQHHSNVVNIQQHKEQISTNTKLDTLIGHNDGVEALLTDIKTNTGNIKASIEVGGDLYVSQDEVEAKLDTIIEHNDGVETLLTNLDTAQDTTNGKLDTINTTLTAGGVVDISTLSTHAKQDTTNGKLDILETSNQLNRGFLEQIEGHIETMSENQSTFQSGDDVVVSGVSTSVLQTTTHGKLDILETSNQLIKNNGIRSWGTSQTIEGNLIVLAGATHGGSSSFTTIPTKPLIIYVKSHNVITDWFGVIEGSIDNTTWLSTEITTIPVINASRLGYSQAQQATAYITPPYPYLRVKITNLNGANRGFEIKIIQTS